jgi:hypothetical protein
MGPIIQGAIALAPVIKEAAPLLLPFIKMAILQVQELFGKGPDVGPVKLKAVVDSALAIADQATATGKLAGKIDVEAVVGMVESTIQVLKAAGVLPSSKVTAPGVSTGVQGVQVMPRFESGQVLHFAGEFTVTVR